MVWLADDRNLAAVRLDGEEMGVMVAADRIAKAAKEAGADLVGLRAEVASLESVYFDVLGIAPTRNGALQ